jgi:hypothetical protein
MWRGGKGLLIVSIVQLPSIRMSGYCPASVTKRRFGPPHMRQCNRKYYVVRSSYLRLTYSTRHSMLHLDNQYLPQSSPSSTSSRIPTSTYHLPERPLLADRHSTVALEGGWLLLPLFHDPCRPHSGTWYWKPEPSACRDNSRQRQDLPGRDFPRAASVSAVNKPLLGLTCYSTSPHHSK